MWDRAIADKGTSCPCCGRTVKVYKRPLNSSQARSLIALYKFFAVNPQTWLHVPDYLSERLENQNNDIGLARHWRLLEEMPVTRTDGAPHAGFYRMTDYGFKFVARQTLIPKYAFLYNQTLLGLSDGVYAPLETTSIDEALGEDFNYAELMRS